MTIAISIFVTILNMHVGFLSTDREKIRLMQTLGATRHQILWRLVIPANYATLFNTLRVNVGLSWSASSWANFWSPKPVSAI